MSTQQRSALVITMASVIIVGLTACAGGSQSMQTPKDAQTHAVQFLRESEQIVDVQWPETPKPVAERCDGGVRFQYTATVKSDNDAKANARALAAFWKSEGLSVSPSETDFGSSGNRLYSATADRDTGPRAAYQISATSLVVQVTSTCAEGSVDDHDE
ncbi:hypothetical protein [Curtobacterium sp. NPDC089689]|uniref:hypothetical protein n=1 Tax=Curtobacterium sp. NPDC089689 TaxID=3363968 RepID=UPI0038149C2B